MNWLIFQWNIYDSLCLVCGRYSIDLEEVTCAESKSPMNLFAGKTYVDIV